MSEWTTDPQIIPPGESGFPHYAAAATIQSEPGSGDVQIQSRDSAGAWATGETITTAGRQQIDVANGPAIRVIATGDAKFRLTWE